MPCHCEFDKETVNLNGIILSMVQCKLKCVSLHVDGTICAGTKMSGIETKHYF